MRIHYPKLRSMTDALSLSVSIAFKGTNFYIYKDLCAVTVYNILKIYLYTLQCLFLLTISSFSP